MVRILLTFTGALSACAPSPQEAAMHSLRSDTATVAQQPAEAGSKSQVPGAADIKRQDAGNQQLAAQGAIPESVSAAENPAPSGPADSPAEAQGRRTLSTAFVMMGPDRRLTVELRDGRAMVLRDVVMRAKDYCGVRVSGGTAGVRHCGGYADVAAARPGGASASAERDPAASNPVEPSRQPSRRD